MSRRLYHILFIVLLLIVSYYFNLHESVFTANQSEYTSIKGNYESIALNYYQHGMNFFKPEVNIQTPEGISSKNAATFETPILYYFVAVLYKIFGYQLWIYPLLICLIFLTGLYYLFKTFAQMSHDFFWSIALPVFLLCSPLYISLSNSFSSNIPALSFSLIAWYHFFKYKRSGPNQSLIFSLIFFFLAIAIKPVAFLSFMALIIVFVLEFTNLVKFRPEKKVFRSPGLFALSSLLIFIIIFSWTFYAKHYNNIHESTYFSAKILPLWHHEKEITLAVFQNGIKILMQHYFHYSVYIFLGISIIFILVFIKSGDRLLLFIGAISIAGGIIYIHSHLPDLIYTEYQSTSLLIIPVFILLTVFSLFIKKFPRLMAAIWFKLIIAALIIFNLYYTGSQLNM